MKWTAFSANLGRVFLSFLDISEDSSTVCSYKGISLASNDNALTDGDTFGDDAADVELLL